MDTANIWEDIELIIYLDSFCASCQISSMNKKVWYKIPLNPKSPFKWVFMDIIPSKVTKSLTSDTTFSSYISIVDAYPKISKLHFMEKITTEEVMYKLYSFQSRFGKVDEFGWWGLERVSADAGTECTSTEFKQECQTRRVHLTLAAPVNGSPR